MLPNAIQKVIDSSVVVKFRNLGSKYIEIPDEKRVIEYITPHKILNNMKCFRASEIYDLCPMREYIYFLNKENRVELVDSRSRIYFRVGEVLHHAIRGWIKKGNLWGYHECERCNLVIDKLTNDDKCPACSDNTKYYEVDILVDNFSGNIDAFVGEDINHLKICDIKTANINSFGDVVMQGTVNPKYLYQVNSYIYLVEKKFPDLKIKDAVFIFFNKSSSEFFDVEVSRNDDIINDILTRIKSVKDSILNNRPPEIRICKDYNDAKNRRCKVFRKCFNA